MASIVAVAVVVRLFIHSFRLFLQRLFKSTIIIRGIRVRILYRSSTPKRYRQLRVKDLPKVP